MKNIKEILRQEQTTCNLHGDRIIKALTEIRTLLPLTPQRFNDMSTHELGITELLTGRFAKLQDTIGERVFPLLLEAIGENITNKSFIDRLNLIEKLEYIDSTDRWLTYRRARNIATHEYPDNLELMVSNLEEIIKHAQSLVDYWQELSQKIDLILEAQH